jgi:hypothetical protein
MDATVARDRIDGHSKYKHADKDGGDDDSASLAVAAAA